MKQVALKSWPSGVSEPAVTTRWMAWFARYIDTQHARKRRQRARQAWAGFDRRALADIGVSQAQRFIAINTPFKEH